MLSVCSATTSFFSCSTSRVRCGESAPNRMMTIRTDSISREKVRTSGVPLNVALQLMIRCSNGMKIRVRAYCSGKSSGLEKLSSENLLSGWMIMIMANTSATR